MKILYFASLRESLGLSEEEIDQPFDTVQNLIEHLSLRGDLWLTSLAQNQRLQIAVNQQLARRTTVLSTDDEVAFFPPVTGG